MNYLETKIKELISIHNSVLKELNELDDENFFKNLEKVRELSNSAKFKRNELKLSCKDDLLQELEQDLVTLTKQIQNTFDNIAADKREQLDLTAAELKKLNNQKKIMQYER